MNGRSVSDLVVSVNVTPDTGSLDSFGIYRIHNILHKKHISGVSIVFYCCFETVLKLFKYLYTRIDSI